MPKSKVRKKPESVTPSTLLTSKAAARAAAPSPTWYVATFSAVLLIGLAYLVTYYLAGDKIHFMQSLNGWNFAVGFGVLVVGLIMAVRWR